MNNPLHYFVFSLWSLCVMCIEKLLSKKNPVLKIEDCLTKVVLVIMICFLISLMSQFLFGDCILWNCPFTNSVLSSCSIHVSVKCFIGDLCICNNLILHLEIVNAMQRLHSFLISPQPWLFPEEYPCLRLLTTVSIPLR